MRFNVFTFNQVNLQRACGYQAVVVSGGSGAVRLSLHSLLQWRAVTACSFCLGILQRFCLFFYPGPPSLLFVLFTSFVFLSTD